jgi:hypothetical protein
VAYGFFAVIDFKERKVSIVIQWTEVYQTDQSAKVLFGIPAAPLNLPGQA